MQSYSSRALNSSLFRLAQEQERSVRDQKIAEEKPFQDQLAKEKDRRDMFEVERLKQIKLEEERLKMAIEKLRKENKAK